MAKLQNLKPRLGTTASRFASTPRDERARSKLRSQTEPSFKWLNSARWKKLRMACLLAAGFTCKKCGILETDSSKLVADHIVPHRNDPEKFWNGALQCLCRTCHSSTKQAEEASMPKGIWY